MRHSVSQALLALQHSGNRPRSPACLAGAHMGAHQNPVCRGCTALDPEPGGMQPCCMHPPPAAHRMPPSLCLPSAPLILPATPCCRWQVRHSAAPALKPADCTRWCLATPAAVVAVSPCSRRLHCLPEWPRACLAVVADTLPCSPWFSKTGGSRLAGRGLVCLC